MTPDEKWQKLSKAFFTAPPVNIPADFTENVMQKIKATEPSISWTASLRWFIPAFGTAAVALLLNFEEPSVSTIPVTENLILASSEDDPSLAWIESDDSTVDDVLGFSVEEL